MSILRDLGQSSKASSDLASDIKGMQHYLFCILSIKHSPRFKGSGGRHHLSMTGMPTLSPCFKVSHRDNHGKKNVLYYEIKAALASLFKESTKTCIGFIFDITHAILLI